jgi:hypothetical protein
MPRLYKPLHAMNFSSLWLKALKKKAPPLGGGAFKEINIESNDHQ